MFKSTVDDGDVLERIADYFDKKKIKKVALLADSSGFGQGAVAQMEMIGPKRGLDVVYESFGPADTDMMPQLTRIRDSGAEAIICWTVTPAGVVFLKQAQQLGLDNRNLIHSYGFVSADYMELAGEAANAAAAGQPQTPGRGPIAGQRSAEGRHSQAVPQLSAPGSAGRRAFTRPSPTMPRCWRSRRSARSAGIRPSFRRGSRAFANFAGISGVFDFSPEKHSGLSKRDIVLINWRDGRFNLVDYK